MDQVLAHRQPDLTVLLERVNKPHNLSAIVRTADTMGVGEVHAVSGGEALPTMRHTTQGSHKWVAIHRHLSIKAAATTLKNKGLLLLGAHLSPDARDFREMDLTRPIAFVLGTELFGLTDEMLAHCDERVVIPTCGMTQSLNVSVAGALLLSEAERQRRAAGMYAQQRISSEEHAQLRFEWLHPKLARFCQDRKLAYPALNDAGDLAEPWPYS